MSVKEKLLQEYEAAINAVLGDNADKEEGEEYNVDSADIDLISKKTKFYMDL